MQGKPSANQIFCRESVCPLHVPSHSHLFPDGPRLSRIRDRTSDSYRWSTEAWRYAFDGNLTYASVPEALMNSLFYAIGCLLVACLLGFLVAQTIHSLEERNKPKLAQAIDVLSMLPLALSASWSA